MRRCSISKRWPATSLPRPRNGTTARPTMPPRLLPIFPKKRRRPFCGRSTSMDMAGLSPTVLLGTQPTFASMRLTAAPTLFPVLMVLVPAIPSEAKLCTGTYRMRSFWRWARMLICGSTHPRHSLTFTKRRRSSWTRPVQGSHGWRGLRHSGPR